METPADPDETLDPADEPEEGETTNNPEPTALADDPLAQFAERAAKGRLPAAEEDEAAKLVTAALGEGREGLARVVEQLPKLPWIVGVNGVTAAWPELKPATRNRLLASLGRVDSDAARRVRLSLARGLFKLDPPVASKIAVGVAKEMRDKETGALPLKSAQLFANVLIGRAKPWIAQLSVENLKPAEAEILVHAALMAVFQLPHTPVTQLGVIKWASASGKLAKLDAPLIEVINKGLTRWSAKWQGVLRREVEGLPEEILASLKASPAPAAPEAEERDEDEISPVDNDDAEPSEDEADSEDADAPRPAPKPRPVYESKTIPPREREERERGERKPGGHFNLSESLRQIEAHVASLRAELGTAQSKLRQRDDDSRKRGKPERQPAAPVIPGEPSADELARLNVQLEARNTELQGRIDELTADAEDRAAAAAIATDAPVTDEDLRLRQLLILKLQESYDDFLALENTSPDIVAPKHYRTVLGRVFEVLAAEGIFPAAPTMD